MIAHQVLNNVSASSVHSGQRLSLRRHRMEQLSSTQPHDINLGGYFTIFVGSRTLKFLPKKKVQPGRFVKLSSKLFWVRRLSNQGLNDRCTSKRSKFQLTECVDGMSCLSLLASEGPFPWQKNILATGIIPNQLISSRGGCLHPRGMGYSACWGHL